jgi:hypothetical protein
MINPIPAVYIGLHCPKMDRPEENVKAEVLHYQKMDGPEENGKSRCTALPENGRTRGKW